MKDFLKKSIGVIVLLLLAFIAFLSFYRFHFQGGLTNDHSIWSDFGSIFNGILSPIFAAINICIFWYLTRVVDDNNDHRQHKAEKHERAMIEMQFRKAEIDRFEEIMSDALVPVKENDLLKSVRPILLAMTYLESFLHTKLQLFDLNGHSETAQNIISLHNDFDEYYKKIIENNDVLKEFMEGRALTDIDIYEILKQKYIKLPTDIENSFSKELIKDMLNRKNLIITTLQEITLNP